MSDEHPQLTIATSIKTVVKCLIDKRALTYSEIAVQCGEGVSADGIKQFVRKDHTRINSTNVTMTGLLNFVRANEDLFEQTCPKLFLDHYKILFRYKNPILIQQIERAGIRTAYENMYKMLNIELKHNGRLLQRIEGTYICLRCSSKDDHVVRSEITIKPYERENPNGVWEYLHKKVGPLPAVTVEADGLMFCLGDGIYLTGDIEEGAGVEMLHLHAPIMKNSPVITGLTMTLGRNASMLCSKIVLYKPVDGADNLPEVIPSKSLNSEECALVQQFLCDKDPQDADSSKLCRALVGAFS